MTPKVSIIIPLYNKERYIERALKSVLNQKLQDFEIIVVDDGSTDQSSTVVKNISDPRIKLIQQENKGVSIARNRGVNAAVSDFITFLDADDEWCPELLETLLYLWNKYPQGGLYFTAYKIRQLNGKEYVQEYRSIPPEPWEGIVPSFFSLSTLCDQPVSTSSVGVPKCIFYEMGGFLENLSMNEDAELWGRIAIKYPVVFSWKIGSIYHKESLDRACINDKKISEHQFIKTGKKLLENGLVPPQQKESLIEYIEMLKLTHAVDQIKAGYPKNARIQLSQCKSETYFWKKVIWYILSFCPGVILKNVWLNLRMLYYLLPVKL